MPFVPANPYESFFSGQGRRSYNNMPDTKQASFGYVFNPSYDNGNGLTGQFQPLTSDNQGALRVNIGTGINIAATITGISVSANSIVAVTGFVNVTGNINLTNPLLAVSGVVQANITNSTLSTNPTGVVLNSISGQLVTLNTAIASLTGTISNRWQKVVTTGYANLFTPITGRCLINKVNGYSKTPLAPGFIQMIDGFATGINPISLAVQSGSNYWYEFADDGVEFSNGFAMWNSSDPINVQTGLADFTAQVIFKML